MGQWKTASSLPHCVLMDPVQPIPRGLRSQREEQWPGALGLRKPRLAEQGIYRGAEELCGLGGHNGVALDWRVCNEMRRGLLLPLLCVLLSVWLETSLRRQELKDLASY